MTARTEAELRALVQARAGRLDLSLAALGATAAFAPFLPGGTFTLTAVTARAEIPGGVRITGTGTGVFATMSVTAEVTAGTTEARLAVKAVGTAAWTFAVAFPILAPTLWKDLTFQAPTLRLDSAGASMTFAGTLRVTTPFALIDVLCSGIEHHVTGEVRMMEAPAGSTLTFRPVPSIHLLGPDAPPIDLGLFRLKAIRYEIEAIPWFNWATADYDIAGRLRVYAGVPVTHGGRSTDIGLSGEIASWTDGLVLAADLSPLGALTLAEAAGAGGLGAHDLTTPFGIVFGGPVALTEVRVLVTAPLGIGHVVLTLETSEAWDLGWGFILDALDVVFRIDDPLGPRRKLTGTVSGLLGFGEEGTLQVAADFDDRSFGGALDEDSGPLSIREVFADLTGRDPAHFPDLLVQSFELFGSLPVGDDPPVFQASLELDGDWAITGGLELTRVGFFLDYGQDAIFSAWADLLVGGVLVSVTAGHEPVRGWSFSGSTGPGRRIPIGPFVDELARDHTGLALPAPLAGLTISDLTVAVSTGDGRLFVTGTARFPIDTTEVDVTVAIDTAARTFGGHLDVVLPGGAKPRFDLWLSSRPEASRWAATYTHGPSDPLPTVKELVTALSRTAGGYVPDGIRVSLRNALIASDGTASVAAVELAATLNLAKLPVVGPRLAGGKLVGFDPLRVISTSAALPAAEVAELNKLLPAESAALPAQDLPAGFTLSGMLRLGPLEQPVTLPVTTPLPSTPVQARTADNVLWQDVQTDFGPVHVARVGLSYVHEPGQDARLAVLVDASVTVGGLTLTCDRLSAGISLADPASLPVFDLAGLGLSYAEGPVKISGAFLKNTVTYRGKPVAAYSGKAVISTETFTLGALGSYMELPEGPSLFVYAFLDRPIGGPAFFFVRGIAAGFGYNRRFIAPPVSKIAEFPLVAEAVGTRTPEPLAGELARLEQHLPPSPGDYFLALGVHFTTFEMIDSFLLVTVGFGHRFELNVLGLSTLVLPAPDAADAGVTPVAEIQLALRTVFAPGDGYFDLRAELTGNSYLLSRACRLTGGFAFVTWFGDEHHGDFVLSAGGYHPHFTVPAHYPSVPRLGFNWQVSDQLVLKGSAYYAMTPSALMAGGALSAIYEDGALRAWFDTSLDFLIAWQPYHYEAEFRLAVGASYTFSFLGTHTINVHVGTDVRFWGPDFGGDATIDLTVISFTITFGSQSGKSAQAVPWSRFRDTQLPERAKVTTVALRGGLVRAGTGDDLGVVNPLELELVTDSVVPSLSGKAGQAELDHPGTRFGVAPTGVKDGFTSVQTIKITRNGRSAEKYFRYEAVKKDLPAAQWGDSLTPSLTKPPLVKDVLTGYVIRAVPALEASGPVTIPAARLRSPAPISVQRRAFSWAAVPAFRDASQEFDPASGAAARVTVAGKLLPGADLDLAGLTSADFLADIKVAVDD